MVYMGRCNFVVKIILCLSTAESSISSLFIQMRLLGFILFLLFMQIFSIPCACAILKIIFGLQFFKLLDVLFGKGRRSSGPLFGAELRCGNQKIKRSLRSALPFGLHNVAVQLILEYFGLHCFDLQ